MTRSATSSWSTFAVRCRWRDKTLAAKKVEMALHSMICRSFPATHLGIVGRSEVHACSSRVTYREAVVGISLRHELQHGFL